ncbi:hypothetical protein PF011_g13144 [Phytophthora fragariae]|uniref:Retrotransposon gag domain-containing protein n=1 Tax=Phytophthora fragariae TaxID=53985 RepID=A0A6A3K6M5_9STRA|nr:hypothetical protein PF011_g13144 [Phytophthora fragariae]
MEPSDHSSSSDSIDGDSDSSSPVYSAASSTMGDMFVTFKPYMYPTGLEDFDEDAPLPWSNRTKLFEFKLMMSPAERNWRGQLPKHERRDWCRLSKRFKREYCRSKVSDAESYYTMTQDKDEKALAFLHRLNLAAERAGVDFRKNSRGCQRHVRRFVKNVSDDQLKLTLREHRFRKVADLEYIL